MIHADPEAPKGFRVTIEDKLNALLYLNFDRDGVEIKCAGKALGGSMVAEEGFEPPTRGL
jgi:hypothetical protein